MKKDLVGFDVFLENPHRDPEKVASMMKAAIQGLPLELKMITNRGVKVWPEGMSETFCTDHWRCRLVAQDKGNTNLDIFWQVMKKASDLSLDVIKIENLYLFDGERGYTMGQGE